MGNIRLYGSTSGYTELAPPAVAPDGVLSLPSGVGTLLTAEGGKVLQIVRATDTTDRTTTSATFVDASISVTITPQKSTSAILLIWSVSAINNTNGQGANLRISDSSNNAISGAEDVQQSVSGAIMLIPFAAFGYATPATTSPVTFKGRFRCETTGTTTLRNATNHTGQLYAIEVSA
jgi:hypothetical protein